MSLAVSPLPIEGARRVMIVEEDFTRRLLLTSMLSLCEAEVVLAAPETAEAAVADGTIDVVFVNLNTTRGSGLELIRRLRKSHPEIAFTSIGHDLHPDLHIAAVRLGVRTFLPLPFGTQAVAEALQQTLGAAHNAA